MTNPYDLDITYSVFKLNNSKVYYTGPAQHVFETGEGGGVGGYRRTRKRELTRGNAPSKNFDLNSSKMTGNAFQNNKRNV